MSKTNIFITHWLIGLGIITFAFACSPQKKTFKEPIKEKGAEFLFNQLKNNEFKFEWLTLKLSSEVISKKSSNSFNVNARIRKDSLIWISISPALGIEAFRILITTDSVKMLNRLESNYFEGDFKYISSLLKTDLDFDMIQSLLLGNDFSSYENNVFKASINERQYLLSTIGRGKLKKQLKNTEDSLNVLVQDIWLDPETYKISKLRIKKVKENKKLEASYSNFINVDSMLFPGKIEFEIADEKNKIEIRLENNKVSTTGPLEFPFNVSEKYKNK